MKKIAILISFVFIALLTYGAGAFPIRQGSAAYAYSTSAEPLPTSLTSESPANIDELRNADDEQIAEWSKLQKFDGRTYNYVTPQKYQASSPICWAYATAGLAEISILREGIAPKETNRTLDFDDEQIAYATKNRKVSLDPLLLTKDDVSEDPNSWLGPGYLKDACLSLANGYSPIPEQTDGKHEKDMLSDYIAEQVITVDNTQDAIKKAILKYGGVGFSYSSASINDKYMCKHAIYSDHVSVIVGWDDNVDKNLFSPIKPNHNGAWIVKNSWGEQSGADSVNDIYAYYVSYENTFGVFVALNMGLRSEYPNIYQYDGDPVSDSSYISDIEASGVIFEAKLSDAKQQEFLDAIQLSFNQDNVDLDISVYKLKNVNPGNVNDRKNIPEQGEPLLTQEAEFPKAGAYIIKLNEKIPLDQGEYFSIVVKDKHGKDIKLVCAIDQHSVNDMTYFFQNGEWKSYKYDNSYVYANNTGNKKAARLRAITKTQDRAHPLDGHDLKYAKIEIDNRLLLYKKNTLQVPAITVVLDGHTLQQNRDYSVNITNNMQPGQATVTITGQNGYSGIRTTMFEIAKPFLPDNVPDNVMTVYNDVTFLEDIALPEGWAWIEQNQKLTEKPSMFNIKYEGEDSDCFINLFSYIWVNRLDQDPPEKQDLSTAQIEITGHYTYTGEPIIPTVVVMFDGKVLRQNSHYTLSVDNNTNAGIANVTIRGIGLYKGEATITFAIHQAEWPKQTPQDRITVSRKAQTLSDILLNCEGWVWENPELPITSDTFVATAIYNGDDRSNYNNTQMSITILKEDRKDIATINELRLACNSFVYDGEEKKPNVIATDGKIVLEEGIDFETAYDSNINAGNGIVTVSGIGDYAGSSTLSFTIEKANRAGFAVDIEGWTYGQHSNLPTASNKREDAEIKYEYCIDQYGNYSPSIPTDAGTYYVRGTIAASQNYTKAVAYKRFTILKATGTMSATIQDWTFGEPANAPSISSDTNSTSDPTITYSRLNESVFSSATPTFADDYEMKIVLPESKNYTSCEKIIRFTINKAEKPNNVPTTINASKNTKTLSDIILPTGWEWEDPNFTISENTTTAKIVRTDAENYKQSTFVIELRFVLESEQPVDKHIATSILWWGLGIIGGITLVGTVCWIISRRKNQREDK